MKKISLPIIAIAASTMLLAGCYTRHAETTTVKRTTVETQAPDPYAPPPPAASTSTTTTTTETYRAPAP